MTVKEVITVITRTTPDKAIEILASAIKEREDDIEILKQLQREMMEEVGDGFQTDRGRIVSKRSRTTNYIDVEMFYLTDKEKYLKLAEEGKLTVPASCYQELDMNGPYVTKKTTEFYVLKGDIND